MPRFQIRSIDAPIAQDNEAALAVARLVTRAEFLGMLTELRGAQVIDREFLSMVLSKFSDAGIGREDRILLTAADDAGEYRRLVERVLEQTEHSPMPDNEWGPLQTVLGDEMLADLLGISPASVRRYSHKERATPDDVANRLHFLALVVADLSGAYNEYGIRRWFARPRQTLGGQAPIALLGAGFEPSSDDAAALRRLAGELAGAGTA